MSADRFNHILNCIFWATLFVFFCFAANTLSHANHSPDFYLDMGIAYFAGAGPFSTKLAQGNPQ